MSNLNFLMPDDEVKEGVLIVDLSQLASATMMHVFKEGDKINTPMMRHLVLSTLKHNVLKFRNKGYNEVIICVDNAQPCYWRREFAYYYKRNRSKGRETSNWDWEGYFEGIKEVIDEFKKYMPYRIIDVPKAEADDGIAVLTKLLSSQGHKVLIVSSDGDFVQLHKFPGVSQYSPMAKKFVKSKTGSPALDLMTKVIKGDRKDNVASIKVRSDFYYTMVEGERTPPTKSTFVEKCLDNIDDIQTILTEAELTRFKENQVLIDFDYIRDDIKNAILETYNNYNKPGKGRIYSYFVKSGLSKLIKDINDF